MSVNIEIFSQGNEVITGQTVDTNASWLSQQLVIMGYTVTRHTAVGDHMDDLVALLQEISVRADCCICTGGLGPTVDDLTAEAVSNAFELPLEFDQDAYRQIEQFFNRRNRHIPESNRKQAMLPQGSIRLDNEWGTAPGFTLTYNDCLFAFVPGVPFEMKQLFREKIRPMLDQKFSVEPSTLVTIKTVGIGESDIQERLENLSLPQGVQLGFRTGMDENQTKLQFPPGFPESEIEPIAFDVAQRIGDPVFTITGISDSNHGLVDVIDEILSQKKSKLAVVESVSHGLLSAKCMGYSFLDEAVFLQSLDKLFSRLDMNYSLEDEMESAAKIAEAVKSGCHADIVLVQLYQGMKNDGLDHPSLKDKDRAITLYNVLATENRLIQQSLQLGGTMKRKQNQAALSGLDFLRKYLQNKI